MPATPIASAPGDEPAEQGQVRGAVGLEQAALAGVVAEQEPADEPGKYQAAIMVTK